MSSLRRFLLGEEKEEIEVKYPATNKFVDENGKPLEWVLKVLTKEELEIIYEEAMRQIIIDEENGLFGYVFDSNLYLLKLITKSVIFPNLMDLELQRSYGVSSDTALLKKLVDSPSEFRKFCEFVEEINAEEKTFEEEVEEIKELINTDVDASYAHYCLHKLKMLPSEYLNLPRRERQFIIASIQLKTELETQEYEKMKH